VVNGAAAKLSGAALLHSGSGTERKKQNRYMSMSEFKNATLFRARISEAEARHIVEVALRMGWAHNPNAARASSARPPRGKKSLFLDCEQFRTGRISPTVAMSPPDQTDAP
jgi:hypothetical protein